MGLLTRFREAVAASTQPQLQRGAPREDGKTTGLAEGADTGSGPVGDPDGGTTDTATGECQACGGSGQRDGQDCQVCGGTGRAADPDADDPNDIREAEPRQAALRLLTGLREATGPVKTGKARYEVTIIQEGLGNPDDANYYTKRALQEAVRAGLFDGLQAYANHPSRSEERDRPERDVRDLVGHYENAAYREANGRGMVRATFIPIDGPAYQWVTSLIEAAIAKKTGAPLAGISIDGGGTVTPGPLDAQTAQFAKGLREGDQVNFVERIDQLPSADIVTRPGAGGQFDRRLLESLRTLSKPARQPGSTEPEEVRMTAAELQQKMVAATARLREAASNNELTDEQAQTALKEAITELDQLGETEIEEKVEIREVEKPVTDRDDIVPVERFREVEQRATDAEGKVAQFERNLLIGRVLRESELPETEHEFVMDALKRADSEDDMRRAIDLHKKQADRIAAQIREATSPAVRVEGAFPRTPTSTDTGERSIAADLGIPADDLKPEEAAA